VEGQTTLLRLATLIHDTLLAKFYQVSPLHRAVFKHHMYQTFRIKANLVSLCFNTQTSQDGGMYL
jgi:hypothetical protein